VDDLTIAHACALEIGTRTGDDLMAAAATCAGQESFGRKLRAISGGDQRQRLPEVVWEIASSPEATGHAGHGELSQPMRARET
jgi:hypothetical protein